MDGAETTLGNLKCANDRGPRDPEEARDQVLDEEMR